MTIRFTLRGAPRTKKTHQKIISIPKKGARKCHACGHRPGFPKIIPSDAHQTWQEYAMQQCAAICAVLRQKGVELPIASLVNVAADFYQDVDRADAVGLYESLGDLLQDAGILANDKLIASWNGSRRLKDAARPRIEVEITVLAVENEQMELLSGVTGA